MKQKELKETEPATVPESSGLPESKKMKRSPVDKMVRSGTGGAINKQPDRNHGTDRDHTS